MDDSKIIDALGGTTEVARLCRVRPPSVSGWRSNGIPDARRQYLELLRPDVFHSGAAANNDDCSGAPDEQGSNAPATGSDVEVPHGVEAQAAGQGGDVVHAGHRGSRAGRDA